MPDGVNIPGGPSFIGNPQPPDVPCDPVGDGWRGPQGPQGPPGQSTAFYGVSPPGDVLAPLWWDTVSGQLYIQYNDGSSTQWVVANSTIANGGPFLPITGGTVTGPLTLASTLKMGSLTATGFGSGIGQILPPFVSSGGQNIPVLYTDNRIILRKRVPTATDFVDFQFDRTTTYTGGTLVGNKNRVVSISTTIGAGDGANNWNLVNTVTNNSTAGGFATAQFNQVVRSAGSNGWMTGGLFDTIDQSSQGSLASAGKNQACLELDLECNGPDDGANTQSFGGKGIRKQIHCVGIRWDQANNAQTEISTVLWMTTSSPTGSVSPDPNVNFQQIIGFAPNTQVRSVLDSRGAITPTGSSNPVNAVTMSAGHVVDFNGGAALDSAPGNYLQYRTATQRLYYVVAGVDQWSIDASGNVRARGTVTGSTTP